MTEGKLECYLSPEKKYSHIPINWMIFESYYYSPFDYLLVLDGKGEHFRWRIHHCCGGSVLGSKRWLWEGLMGIKGEREREKHCFFSLVARRWECV